MRIHLHVLPKNDVWIKLEENLQRDLINKGYKIAGTYRKMARLTGVTINQLYNQKARDRPKSINFFIKLFSLLKKRGLNHSLEKIEDKVVGIQTKWRGSSIKNPKLPFNFNSKCGATILSGIYFDGGIRGTGRSNYGRPMYNNQEKLMRENFKNACKEVFGDIEFNEDKAGNINLPKIIGIILINCFEYVPGRKSINDPKISNFILGNTNEEVICSFLKQAFSDEGTVNTSEVRLKIVVDVTHLDKHFRDKIKENSFQYKAYAPNLLKGLKFLLEKVNVFVNGPRFDREYEYVDKQKRKHIVFSWEINISGKENLEIFRKKIGFIQPINNEKLNYMISKIKENHLPTKRAIDLVYQKVLKLEKEGRIICTTELAKEINRTQNMANIWLIRLSRRGYIKKASGKGCRFYPYVYKLQS